VPDGARVAGILARALTAAAEQPIQAMAVQTALAVSAASMPTAAA
jgi:hypothetical protein